ncbi:MAG: S26 family signal peptidase, partial [Spirochaetota bacterium]
MSSFSRSYYNYRERMKFKYKIYSFIKLLLLLFILYQVLSVFLLRSYTVNSVSMQPILNPKDKIIVSPLVYGPIVPFTGYRIPGLRPPNRGDIVLSQPAYYKAEGILLQITDPIVRFFTLQKITIKKSGINNGENPYIIKRILAVPGDMVKIDNSIVMVKPKGKEHYYSEFEIIRRDYDIKSLP